MAFKVFHMIMNHVVRAAIKSLPVLDRHCQIGIFKTIYHFMQFYIEKLKGLVFLDLYFYCKYDGLGHFYCKYDKLRYFFHKWVDFVVFSNIVYKYWNWPKGIVSASATWCKLLTCLLSNSCLSLRQTDRDIYFATKVQLRIINLRLTTIE